MLKVVLVLGCLLSLALAHPMEEAHKRLARSDSNSGSNETDRGESAGHKKKKTPRNLKSVDPFHHIIPSVDGLSTTQLSPDVHNHILGYHLHRRVPKSTVLLAVTEYHPPVYHNYYSNNNYYYYYCSYYYYCTYYYYYHSCYYPCPRKLIKSKIKSEIEVNQ
ncbi:hypothetical protein D5F01_LYC00334 [Larimichthys crocea]|uniref:Uncharacterized protein n=1 Tax=Larimichthys crocea TaxID=215358 RepID=A0A6G0J8X6_LARCR|nr:hypothetical protein D5F01_LYC00334 [Larimichthys crocea]